MTLYYAPPDRDGVVLNFGDYMIVETGGTANDTTINGGNQTAVAGGITNDTVLNEYGYETLESGGVSNHTLVNAHGIEFVVAGGIANDTLIRAEGREEIESGGVSNQTTIDHRGTEAVHAGGIANGTIINSGGFEWVFTGGIADNVTFGSIGGWLVLENPLGLTGTLTNWRVGDIVDLLTHVTAVGEAGNKLTVTYGYDYAHPREAIYTLALQQADTHVAFHPDDHGGTELVLVVGQATQTEAFHHLA